MEGNESYIDKELHEAMQDLSDCLQKELAKPVPSTISVMQTALPIVVAVYNAVNPGVAFGHFCELCVASMRLGVEAKEAQRKESN